MPVGTNTIQVIGTFFDVDNPIIRMVIPEGGGYNYFDIWEKDLQTGTIAHVVNNTSEWTQTEKFQEIGARIRHDLLEVYQLPYGGSLTFVGRYPSNDLPTEWISLAL